MSEQFSRNSGYVTKNEQAVLGSSKVLFAGCGIGSQTALAAARLGIGSISLLDPDVVELTNINRQAYLPKDVGNSKVSALKNQLDDIVGEQNVFAYHDKLTEENARSYVAGHDLVYDTIDFLDLPAILALHDAANSLGIPVVSAFSAGWGACQIVISANPSEPSFMRQVFAPHSTLSYTDALSKFFSSIAPFLSKEVQVDMDMVLRKMKDNTPCPASHVIAGALSVAAVGSTAIYNVLTNKQIQTNKLVVVDLPTALNNTEKAVSLL